MIDQSEAINCAFSDWGQLAEILDTSDTLTVIYDDSNSFSGFGGVASFDTGCGYMLVLPTDEAKLARQYQIKLLSNNRIFIIEKIAKLKTGEIRLELSNYDDTEVFNDYNFS
ncbi:hypothetical protein [Francisella philomiragia]|uniref:Uncharacterized protein n=1 Tax=Francisella philomiragia TaxID=28110 RepID=A0ABS1GDB5_9GAMM|nr:hypothetical protein [Francisella philomiragia]MBK2258987.1 hypothetical protein [Francisella philomiragia]MBK2302678.1 hypothetical protein [Francisella philomiragia]